MDRQRTGILIISAVGAFAALLPWLNAPLVGSVSGVSGPDGWIVLGIAAVGVISSLAGDRTKSLSGGARILAVVLGAAFGGLGLWKILDVHKIRQNIGAAGGFSKSLSMGVSAGGGLYLMILVGVALVLLAAALPRRKS